MSGLYRVSFLLISLLTLLPLELKAQWQFEYVRGEGANGLTSCLVRYDFSNAFISARFYGDYLDFLYYRDDFAVPYGEELGTLLFIIGQNSFALQAYGADRINGSVGSTSQIMVIYPNRNDYADLFRAMSNGSNLEIVFPNGASYAFPLTGSAAALSAASSCWESNNTGPIANNPFETNQQGGNPFSN